MKLGIQTVPLSWAISRNWLATEMRLRINQSKVDQYAEEMREGAKFPPPVLFIDPKGVIRVGDGFHRALAHKLNKKKEIVVDLRRGTRLDAILYNITANREQRGLPFSTGDKKKAAITLLHDPVSSKWTQAKIAEMVGCNQPYISQIVSLMSIERPDFVLTNDGRIRRKNEQRELNQTRLQLIGEMATQKLSKLTIGRELGISTQTVDKYLEKYKEERHLVTCPTCGGKGLIKAP